MFVLVCFCRFLWQTIMLTYMSYELVTHFGLSLDLFLGDFWISSHYSLTVCHLKIWIWINSVNIVLINSTACCWSACKQGVVFLFLHYPPDVKCRDGHIASHWHNTELSIYWAISLYQKLSTPQNLLYLKQSLGEIAGKDCRLLSRIWCEWWNRATGFIIPGIWSSAHSDLLLVSHETLPMIFFLHFFFLIKTMV